MNVYYKHMRKIDTQKIAAIHQAVYDLVAENGLINLSMGKVAKAAHVSPATIYIYYADKEDLLSQMYKSVKDLMDNGLAEALAAAETMPEKFRVGLKHFAHRFTQYPKQATLMWALLNNPNEVSAEANAYSQQRAEVLMRVINEAIAQDLLVTDDLTILQAMTFGALTDYLQNGGRDVDALIDLLVARLFKA